MNIFAVERSPTESACSLCDQHVCKMPTESAQMLVNPFLIAAGYTVLKTKNKKGLPYSIDHLNHPSSKWARETAANWMWLAMHAKELCAEYTRRYKKTHYSSLLLRELTDIFMEHNGIPGFKFDKYCLTPIPQVMPDEYKDKSTIKAYRKLYANEKIKFARWRHSKAPDWLDAYKLK